jgi:dTDP-4-amino-4,6-dideoxygalactose transaminase
MAAFSFCNDKIMGTGGEGGMVTSNDVTLWRRAWSLKDNGKSYDAVLGSQHSPGFKWLHESIGTNWRMTEMQAALGRVLLAKLPEFVAARRRNAAMLTRQLADLPGLRLVPPPPEFGHSYYRYYAFVRPDQLCEGWTRDRIMQAMAAEGVPCFSGSCSEIYREKAFSEQWRPSDRLPVARELGETSLCFLVHPTLDEEDMRDTGRAIEKVMLVATRKRALAAGA